MALNYNEIIQKYEKYIFQTYTRQPIAIRSAKGAIVTDVNGKEYIDCVAGIAVFTLTIQFLTGGPEIGFS